MSQIKAFVGHGFEENDLKIVRPFLDYFNCIRDLNIGFTWTSAKTAATKELAEKILELIQDKNLFIGICTKKECFIAPNNLKSKWFSSNILYGETTDFGWKTSDWLIQEIGLSIGRGLDLMLLIQEGLRRPGGLQGNIEYIEFDPDYPEKSFPKILEMLQALIPKPLVAPSGSVSFPTTKDGQADPTDEKEPDWLQPNPNWTVYNYKLALWHIIAMEDDSGEKRISEAFLISKEGEGENKKESWEAYTESTRITLEKGGSLNRLEALSAQIPENEEVHFYLGKAYGKFDQNEKAPDRFILSAQKSQDLNVKLRRLSHAAIAYFRCGKLKETDSIISDMKTFASQTSENEEIVLKTIKELASIKEDKDMQLACMEHLLDFHPDDHLLRFDLAFLYSEQNRDDLALFHYCKIPLSKSYGGILNNIGVSKSNLDLNILAVEAYRKAESFGETLAMSNLAHKFISAGFLPEAEKTCEQATKVQDYHKNIGEAIFRIKKVREAQEESFQKITNGAKVYHEFYRDFARAAAKAGPVGNLGMWQDKRCQLEIKIDNGRFAATGNYEAASAGGLLAMLQPSSPLLLPPKNSKHYSISYRGDLTGFAVKAIFLNEEIRDKKDKTILSETGPEAKDVLLIISDDLQEIRVYEKDAPENNRFYTIKKINDPLA